MKGEVIIIAFENIEFKKYKDETKDKWGKTLEYKEYEKKTKSYSKQKWNE